MKYLNTIGNTAGMYAVDDYFDDGVINGSPIRRGSEFNIGGVRNIIAGFCLDNTILKFVLGKIIKDEQTKEKKIKYTMIVLNLLIPFAIICLDKYTNKANDNKYYNATLAMLGIGNMVRLMAE